MSKTVDLTLAELTASAAIGGPVASWLAAEQRDALHLVFGALLAGVAFFVGDSWPARSRSKAAASMLLARPEHEDAVLAVVTPPSSTVPHSGAPGSEEPTGRALAAAHVEAARRLVQIAEEVE